MFRLLLLLVSTNLLAVETNWDLRNFDLSYKENQGKITLDSLLYQYLDGGVKFNKATELNIVKNPAKLEISYQDLSWSFFKDSNYINQSELLEVSHLNTFIIPNELNVTFNTELYQHKTASAELKIQNVQLECHGKKMLGEAVPVSILADFCANMAEIKIAKIVQQKIAKAKIYLIQNRAFEFDKFSNIILLVNSEQFELSGKIETTLPAYLKAKGSVHHDLSQKLIYFKIDSAKANGINVKEALFDELEQNQSSWFKVSRPYLFFYY